MAGAKKRDIDQTPSTPLRAPKRSGVSAREDRFDSERPTEPMNVPDELRAPLTEDAEDPRVQTLRDLYAAGEMDAALLIAQTIDPTAPDGISRTAETIPAPADDGDTDPDRALESGRIPRILFRADEVAALPIDHRAGFLLAHIDGRSSIDQILDVCAMPATEALTIVGELVALGIVTFAPKG